METQQTDRDPQDDVPFPLHLQSAGQALNAASDTNVLPWNDIGALERYLGTHGSRTAAVIMEPVMCNTGVVAPRPGYLQAVRELCSQHGVVFVMDEVITGFRVAPGGAQQLFDVRADLSVFAKALGGGFPVAALGGRADIMQLIGSGRVNHSGTYNANLTSVAACVATLRHLQRDGEPIHAHIERIGSRLIQGIRRIAANRAPDLRVSGFPSVFHTHFGVDDVTDYYSYGRTDARRLDRLMEALLEKGVRPMSRGTWFVSAAHTDTDVDITLDTVDRTLAELSSETGRATDHEGEENR